MTEPIWQKSTYSEEGSACVYLATTPTGTILLRESDEPETILTIGPRELHALITTIRPRHQGPASFASAAHTLQLRPDRPVRPDAVRTPPTPPDSA
ncbi:DUF397 domain-containing protein [Streptomyces sp. NPDC050997]|uniref:DUF397 domain-containing protein n=1 Tax=Streptomyces sp. NPDC050997 TaxID=3155519 RepID=UPI00343EB548